MSAALGLLLAAAQGADVDAILKAYRAARPGDEELRLYTLDWAADLKGALARAAKEGRPVFLVATRQLEDAGSLYSGHC
jgi:hypothetical protein